MHHVALEIYNCPYQTQLPLGLMLYTFCVTTIPALHVQCMSTALTQWVDISMHTLTNYQDPPGKLELKTI